MLKRYILILAALCISSLTLVNNAQAQTSFAYAAVDCTVTDPTKQGGFFPIEAIGKSCDTIETRQEHKAAIFSIIVCNFIGVMNDIMVKMYCSMQAALLPVLVATITLYVVLFGAQILMGTAQLSGGEVAKHLLKIGGVWMFATNGAWGVGMIYNFFVGLSIQGIDWVLKIIEYCNNDLGSCPINIGSATSTAGIFRFIDDQLYFTVEHIFFGGERAPLITFFIIILAIQPAIFMMALSLVWLTLTIFVRSLMTFLMGITAVAFLIALSPIFLCFMLFKSTAQFFESWLKYIISYSLQPIITFACLGFWIGITLNFVDFAGELSNTLVSYKELQTKGVIFDPTDTIRICPLEYTNTDAGPSIQCKAGDVSAVKPGEFIELSKIVKDDQFMQFLAYHLITLLIISYAFSSLLKSAPDIARQLAGPISVRPLGAGFDAPTSFDTVRSGLSSLGNMTGGGMAGGASAIQGFTKKFGEMLGKRSGGAK